MHLGKLENKTKGAQAILIRHRKEAFPTNGTYSKEFHRLLPLEQIQKVIGQHKMHNAYMFTS